MFCILLLIKGNIKYLLHLIFPTQTARFWKDYRRYIRNKRSPQSIITFIKNAENNNN